MGHSVQVHVQHYGKRVMVRPSKAAARLAGQLGSCWWARGASQLEFFPTIALLKRRTRLEGSAGKGCRCWLPEVEALLSRRSPRCKPVAPGSIDQAVAGSQRASGAAGQGVTLTAEEVRELAASKWMTRSEFDDIELDAVALAAVAGRPGPAQLVADL